MNALKVVHIEDCVLERRDMAIAFQKVDNLIMVGSTGEADEGLRMVIKHRPDVVILDIEFRNTTKDGIYFLRKLKEMHLPQKPIVIVTTIISGEDFLSPIRKLGGSFIYSKTQKDYGAQLVIGLLTNLQESILERRPIYNEETKRKLEDLIDMEFKIINMKKRHPGCKYLREAIFYLYEGVADYKSVIAMKHGVTDKNVEDAMRYAIRKAWHSADVDELWESYTEVIDTKNGIPTVKDFIGYYYEKIMIRLKGDSDLGVDGNQGDAGKDY